MSNSKIEWTDKVWNPVTGCTKVSQGCKNCYAERLAKGRLSHMGAYANGFENVICHEDRLMNPAQWKKPCKIFVNSMSDLFHENVSFMFINSVFTVMSDIDQHTYQVLTKRPQRMLDFFKWKECMHGIKWQPKSNIWLGVSVENQQTANERIPLLLKIPAAVRFLSCEPLLGAVNLSRVHRKNNHGDNFFDNVLTGVTIMEGFGNSNFQNTINWVIVGGESGHNARPMHPDWLRSIRDQCNKANVPFFFKQWGEWKPLDQLDEDEYYESKQSAEVGSGITSNTVFRLGKKKAGSFLDGKEYKEFPKKYTDAHGTNAQV